MIEYRVKIADVLDDNRTQPKHASQFPLCPPKYCTICRKAWDYWGQSFRVLGDFPTIGCEREDCPKCS